MIGVFFRCMFLVYWCVLVFWIIDVSFVVFFLLFFFYVDSSGYEKKFLLFYRFSRVKDGFLNSFFRTEFRGFESRVV